MTVTQQNFILFFNIILKVILHLQSYRFKEKILSIFKGKYFMLMNKDLNK